MKKIMLASAIACFGAMANAASWTGRIDRTSPPSIGGWQSLKSADQAFGVSKRVYYVDTDGQPVLNLGLFAGVSKPLFSEPAAAPHALGGVTVAVPGSALDWALGTKWGDAWLPALKTGLLCAYDLTRLKALKAVPDFVGVGASWTFGG